MAGAEQQHGGQGNPAAHGVHHHRTGEVMKLLPEVAFEPGLDAEVLIPGNAFKKRIDKTNQHKGGGQLRVELGPFGNTPGNNGRNGRRKSQQKEEAGDVVAALFGDLAGADKEVGAIGHGKADGEISHRRYGKISEDFHQCIDLVLFAYGAHF